MIGYLSMSRANHAAAKTTNGMLVIKPKRSRNRFPLEAPARARTLSKDMVKSATKIIQIACQIVAPCFPVSSDSTSSIKSLTAIQKIRAPPISLIPTILNNCAAKIVKAIRKITANPDAEE